MTNKIFAVCRTWRTWAIALLFLPVLVPLDAQNEEQNEAVVTDDYLLKMQRSYLLNLIIYSNDSVEKHLAIQRLAKLIDEGQFCQGDRGTISTLTLLAIQKNYDRDGNLVNDDLFIRAAVCNLLGKLGGDIAQSALISIMLGEHEPIIAAVVIENLLRIDPKGNPALIDIMVNTFYKYHYTNRSNTLASSMIFVSAQYAANTQGRLLSPNLLQAVHNISLASNGYATNIRTKARTLVLDWMGAEYPILDAIR